MADYKCRSCGSPLEVVLDLGRTPVADTLLAEVPRGSAEPAFPLVVGFCDRVRCCSSLRLLDQEDLYSDDYPYFTSEVPGWSGTLRSERP